VGVYFQNDNICTIDTDSDLRLTIMSSIAADEVRKLSERVRWGHRRSIESGNVLGNNRIFGYNKQDCRLVINETEAVAVRICQNNPVHLQIGVATVEVEVVKSPTCTEMGEKRHTATFENPVFATQVMTSRIQPLGHAWGGWSRKKEPTCTDPGIETRTCVRDSSHTQTREVAANGHDWGVWSVTTPATETNEGVETRTCISCRKTETRARHGTRFGKCLYNKKIIVFFYKRDHAFAAEVYIGLVNDHEP
jgi:hypothetical protein